MNQQSPLCICDQENHHHECPRANGEDDLEPVASIAERVFPDAVAEIRAQHIDSDCLRGKSDWDRECQESRRLNRR
jgi:hypothetical protein